MSFYQPLAARLRPDQFAKVIGQEQAVTVLQRSLALQRVFPGYLFYGKHGCGKTTLARLCAAALNCDQGIQTEPCQRCQTCQAITTGRCLDVQEVDGASRTKVEDTKQLLEWLQFRPVSARYKILIIDEVHMLSLHSFNALLKTLEEPPSYVVMIFATTHPEKMPETLRSRCLQISLQALSQPHMLQHLQTVLRQQGYLWSDAVVNLLVEAADGSVRDALLMIEQLSLLSDQPSLVQAYHQLGLVDSQWLAGFVKLILEQDKPGLRQAIGQLQSWQIPLSKSIHLFQQNLIAWLIEDNTILHQDWLSLKQKITAEKIVDAIQAVDAMIEYANWSLPDASAWSMLAMRLWFSLNQPSSASSSACDMIAEMPAPTASADQIVKLNSLIDPIQVAPPVAMSQHDQTVSEPNQANHHEWWLSLLPTLGLEGLVLQLAKQSVCLCWSAERVELLLPSDKYILATPKLQQALREALASFWQHANLQLQIASCEKLPYTSLEQRESQQKKSDDQLRSRLIQQDAIWSALEKVCGVVIHEPTNEHVQD